MSTTAFRDRPMDTDSTQPPSVLVVDDDTVSRLVLAHMLRRLGYAVVEADDLQPALELAGAGDFQLIVSDYAMPGGTGLQLLADLPPDKRPAFVLVTGIAPDAVSGSADATRRADAVRSTDTATSADEPVAGRRRFEVPAGRTIDGYLTKPVSTRAVRACLQSVLTAQDH
jgi:CheY-like chemotaxis protein